MEDSPCTLPQHLRQLKRHSAFTLAIANPAIPLEMQVCRCDKVTQRCTDVLQLEAHSSVTMELFSDQPPEAQPWLPGRAGFLPASKKRPAAAAESSTQLSDAAQPCGPAGAKSSPSVHPAQCRQQVRSCLQFHLAGYSESPIDALQELCHISCH